MNNALFDEYKRNVDSVLATQLKSDGEAYSAALNAAAYSVENGGKRIRPCLLMEFARICGGNTVTAAEIAAAVEMVHTYSLIHDDLPCMDNDDLRRGRPACHIKFGEDTALLAGDGLLTRAFSIIADADIPADRAVACVSVLSRLAGFHGMIGGQVIDLEYENKKADKATLLQLCGLKTSCLLQAACKLGCLLSGAEPEKIKAADEYAYALGIAFQITDDILDVTGDEKLLGKPIGSDADNNKSTFVSLYGVEGAARLADEYTERAVAALAVFGDCAENLKNLAYTLLGRKS